MDSTAKGWRWVYAGMAAAMFVGMVAYSGFQEFWYDEVYQIGLVGSGLSPGDVFREYTQLKDYTPPLYAFLAYIWIRIVPFSFRYLLLISELLTAVGVFFVALAGEKTGGKKMGILAGLLAVVSSVLVLSAGYEFRAYGLYFMASAIVLYRLAVRTGTAGEMSKRAYVWDTLVFILLLYSHYYGSVLLGVLFVLDIVFVAAKKQKRTILLPYIISGCCFLPWMILVFLNRTRSITEFWVQPPDLQSVFHLLQYLCSKNDFLLALFCLGFAVCLISVIDRVVKRGFRYRTDAMNAYMTWLFVSVIGLMYLYGAVINPAGGIFYNRYFIGLLPCCFLMTARGVIVLWDRLIVKPVEKRRMFAGLCLALFLFVFIQNGDRFMKEIKKDLSTSYTASVKELSRKPDISEPDTVVVTTDNSFVRAGVEMYFDKLFHTKANVISQNDDGFREKIKAYHKVYVFQGKFFLTQEAQEILARYEQGEGNPDKKISEYVYVPE